MLPELAKKAGGDYVDNGMLPKPAEKDSGTVVSDFRLAALAKNAGGSYTWDVTLAKRAKKPNGASVGLFMLLEFAKKADGDNIGDTRAARRVIIGETAKHPRTYIAGRRLWRRR
jgi:hypothetical protein